MILNAGKGYLTRLISNDMTHGQWGTGTALYLISNTALQAANVVSNTALVDSFVSGSVISTSHTLGYGSATGVTIAEYGVKNGLSGTFYNRINFAGILAGSAQIITIVTFEPRTVD